MATATGRFRPQADALPGMPEQPGPDTKILKIGESHKVSAETIQLSGAIGVTWRDGLERLRHDQEVIVTVTNADGQTIGFAQATLQSRGYKTHQEDMGPTWLEKLWGITR